MIGTKVREERYIGDPDHLANLLNGLAAKGELVSIADPVKVDHPLTGQPSLMVVAQVRDPLPAPTDKSAVAKSLQTLTSWLVRNRKLIAAIAGALTGVTGLGYALYLLVQIIVAHWSLIVGVLAVTFVLWFGLGRAGVCPGLHCPGCRHSH